jgi:hypothetical protein
MWSRIVMQSWTKVAWVVARLKLLLPFRSFDIVTRLSPDDIVHELSPYLDPRERFPFGSRRGDAPWIGRVNRKRLAMRRCISPWARNAFLPNVEAIIEGHAEGARVRVRMRMGMAAEVFSAVWMAGAVAGALGLLAGNPVPARLLGLLVPLAGLLLIGIGFWPEAHHAGAFLREHLPPPAKLSPSPYR